MADEFGLPDLLPALPPLPAGLGQAGPTSVYRRPLLPEESASFGNKLLGMGSGMLGTALHVLDWPGAKLRGVLGGSPGSSLTGKQLMQRWGVLRPGDSSWTGWGTGLAADIATDPLTYTTFGAKSALTPAGGALHKMGALSGWNRKAMLGGFHDVESSLLDSGKTAREVAHARNQGLRIATPAQEAEFQSRMGRAIQPNEPLSGLFRFHVPLSGGEGVTLGSGELSQKIAGGLDKAGDFLRFGNPLGRMIGANFDSRVGRGTTAMAQRAMASTDDIRHVLESQSRGHAYDLSSAIDDAFRDNPAQKINILRAARIASEGSSPLALLDNAADPTEREYLQGLLERFQGAASQLNDVGKGQLADATRMGVSPGSLRDNFLKYVSRQSTSAREGGAGSQLPFGKIMPTVSGANNARKDIWRDIPGGSDRINDWISRFAGTSKLDRSRVAGIIKQDYLNDLNHWSGGQPVDLAEMGIDLDAKVKGITNAISKMDADRYAGQMASHPFFSHDITGDVVRRGSQHARTIQGAAALHDALGRLAIHSPVPQDMQNAVLRQGVFTRLPAALKALGLKYNDPSSARIWEKLAGKNAGPIDELVDAYFNNPRKGIFNKLNDYVVPTKDLDQLSHNYAGWITPEEVKAPIKGFDSLTNAFTAGVYPSWLASHTRNFMSAAMNNAWNRIGLGDYAKQAKLMMGRLAPAEAEAMRRSQYMYAKVFGPDTTSLGVVGTNPTHVTPSGHDWMALRPGTNEHGLGLMGPSGDIAKDTANLLLNEGGLKFFRDMKNWPGSPLVKQAIKTRSLADVGKAWNAGPFGLRGVAGGAEDVFAPVAAGRKFGSNLENYVRGSEYEGLLRQGYSPEMAGKITMATHGDYSRMTPFEKAWMRRLVPFYGFQKYNLGYQLHNLATRPAMFSTPFKPGMVNRGDKGNYVPEYMNDGFTMPLGPEKDGVQRFLSTLGLPQEDVFRDYRLWNGMPDVSGTLQRMAGRLNPLIKGPIEQAANRQFYSGRQLSDLHASNTIGAIAKMLGSEPDTPQTRLATQVIANSPLARVMTSLDKLYDTRALNSEGRKPLWATGLNLLSGAKVTDVDMPRQRHLEMRSTLQSLLSTMPHVRTHMDYYPLNREFDKLRPDELEALRAMTGLNRAGKIYAQRVRRDDTF